MQDKNLSQWFNLDDQKPWEPGVYEVREECDIGKNQKWYSYWDGKKFMYYTHISEHNAFEEKSRPTACITSHWRGLSSDPIAKHKPKARGNRKVTRYVVMAQHKITKAASCDGSFEQKKNAESRLEQAMKICGDTHNMWIQKSRFRTPEAD